MAIKPTRWNRLAARIRREIPGMGLEAYRRASLAVFELFEQAEHRRRACGAEGLDAWAVPPATRAELVCAWNAFVLQVLGNCLLDADYQGDPATRGFVPRGTAEQILAFYTEVEGWMDRARQARSNPAYVLDRPLPAPLPRWSDDVNRLPSHVAGLRHAMRAVRGHAEAAMSFLPEEAEHPRKQAHLERIRQALQAGQSRARHAEELCGAGPRPSAHAFAEAYLRDAIERFWLLGQVIADPFLAERPEIAAHRPLDLGAGMGRAIITRAPRRRFRRRMSARERAHLDVASDPRQPFARRQDAVLEACRGRAPMHEILALYDWLDVPALREMLVFGLQARPEAEALAMIARIARDDPDPQVRHAARFWLHLSRHREAPRLRAGLGPA